jgi:Salmonella virulence plasmid 28.1kDa A protein
VQALRTRTLKRANPLYKNMRHLGLRPSALDSRSYESHFGRREDVYVTSGSVASMFSPSAYLTQLYREACPLHDALHENGLPVRRPDLALLHINKENQDQELSTLSLSNEILGANLKLMKSLSSDTELYEALAASAYGAIDLPYHDAAQSIVFALAAHQTRLSDAARHLRALTPLPPMTQIAFDNNLNPGLLETLLAVSPHSGDLVDVATVCKRYAISRDELNDALGLSCTLQSRLARLAVPIRQPLPDAAKRPWRRGGYAVGELARLYGHWFS